MGGNMDVHIWMELQNYHSLAVMYQKYQYFQRSIQCCGKSLENTLNTFLMSSPIFNQSFHLLHLYSFELVQILRIPVQI